MKEKNPVSKIEDGAFESRFIYSQLLLKNWIGPREGKIVLKTFLGCRKERQARALNDFNEMLSTKRKKCEKIVASSRIFESIRASCMIRLASQLSIFTTANRNRPLAAARFSFFDFSPRRRAQSSLYFWSVKTWTAVSLIHSRIYFLCVKRSQKKREKWKNTRWIFLSRNFINFIAYTCTESCLLHKRKCFLPVNRLENKFWKIFNYFSNAAPTIKRGKLFFSPCRKRVNKIWKRKKIFTEKRGKINIKEKVFPVNSWIAREIV